MKTKLCGVCRQPGHNRQTCGKPATAKSSPPVPKTFNSATGAVKQHRRPGLDSLEKGLGDKNQTYDHSSLDLLFKFMCPAKKDEVGKLFELMQMFNGKPSAPTQSSWKKFFKKFSPQTRVEVLEMYQCGQSESLKEKAEKALLGNQENNPVLSEDFFYVFAKDSSKLVRAKLAERKGIPAGVAFELFEKESSSWIPLAQNEDSPLPVLQSLLGEYLKRVKNRSSGHSTFVKNLEIMQEFSKILLNPKLDLKELEGMESELKGVLKNPDSSTETKLLAKAGLAKLATNPLTGEGLLNDELKSAFKEYGQVPPTNPNAILNPSQFLMSAQDGIFMSPNLKGERLTYAMNFLASHPKPDNLLFRRIEHVMYNPNLTMGDAEKFIIQLESNTKNLFNQIMFKRSVILPFKARFVLMQQ